MSLRANDFRARLRATPRGMVDHPGPLVVPQLVVAETAHFAKRLGAEAEVLLLEDLASGVILPMPVEPPDWVRMAELVWRYRDLPLGIVDASVVAAAERLGITAVATLDRRDFAAVRPAHVEAFDLLP